MQSAADIKTARASLLAGDPRSAIDRLSGADPENSPLAAGLLLARAYRALGQLAKADAILDGWHRQAGPKSELLIELGRTALARGRVRRALNLARQAGRLSPADPVAAILTSQAELVGGRDAEAVETAQETVRRFPDSRSARVNLLKILDRGLGPPAGLAMKDGSALGVVDFGLLDRLLERHPKSVRLRTTMMRALILTGQAESAVATGEAGLALAADNTRRRRDPLPLRLMLAEACLALGKASKALSVLDKAEVSPKHNSTLAELLLRSSHAAGERDRASRLTARLARRVRKQMPPFAIAEALAGIETDRPLTARGEFVLRYAAHVLPADRNPAEWRQRVIWGSRTSKLLQTWARSVEGLDAGAGDPAQTGLAVTAPDWDRHLDPDKLERGAILVGSHCGPFAVGLHTLRRRNPDFFTLGTNLYASSSDASETNLLTHHDPRAARTAIRRLARGHWLGLTPDAGSPTPHDRYQGSLFGQPVVLSALAARLSHQFDVPAFWFQSLWHETGVVIEIAPMVRPGAEESRDAYIARWAGDYLTRLDASFRADPANISPEFLIWNSVARV